MKQYLNIVRIIHQENGFPNPMKDNFDFQLVLRGIRRALGDRVQSKSPITTEMLREIRTRLDLSTVTDSAIWAAMLVGFFGLLRKSNLIPDVAKKFNPVRQLQRQDFEFCQDKINITIKWSKTIQFGQRTRVIPLLASNGNLCPVNAILNHFKITCAAGTTEPAFLCSTKPHVPLTTPLFVRRLKFILNSLGYPPDDFASHSLRRGGACLALNAGLPIEDIRLLGDWSSNAYTAYVFHDYPKLLQIMEKICCV